jgi:OFA family oxalate/formate antiporter-like MFS transporter
MSSSNRAGWVVVAAGTGINLALGVLYAWSVIKAGLPQDWSATEKNLPYAIACLVFALMTVPAGRLQDRVGPRWVAAFGGLLCGLGLILASRMPTVTGFVIGFGLLAGAGIGLGYASATPPAVKWFPPQRTGMVAGIVVAGFGLASAYISPLVTYLLSAYRAEGASADSVTAISRTMMTLGVAFAIATLLLAQLLRTPPAGAAASKPSPGTRVVDAGAGQMLRTRQFYLLWIIYLFAAGAGLMVISVMSQLTKAGAERFGFVLVALLAVGNAGGRIVAGTVSDKIGRQRTMTIVFLAQAALMFALCAYRSFPLPGLIAAATLVGANYGTNLSIFPAVIKEWYGLASFGFNYGILFTSWGVGGFLLSFLLAGKIKDWTGEYTLAFVLAGCLLLVAAALTFVVKQPALEAGGKGPQPGD